jgi:hypothetical protein
MTDEHFAAIVQSAQAKKDAQGWWTAQEGRYLTLYVSSSSSSLTVNRVEAVQVDGKLLKARTSRGETYVLALEDVFAAAIEPEAQGARRAGFG